MISLLTNAELLTVDSEVDGPGVFPRFIRDHTFIHCCVLHCGRYDYQGA